MYSTFYCFSERPFEITPDLKFLYFSRTHQEALDTTIKSIRDRSVFISITGEVGTGKTMLIYSILIRLDEKVKTAFIFHPSMTFPELIRNILQELDQQIVGKRKEALLKQLDEYLCNRLGSDENLVVFIDEAQNLPEEVIDELGKLQEGIPRISNHLQIIFVGQPEFEDKLNSPALRQLNQRIGTKGKIRVLTKEESREYIDHRLKIAGSSASHLFTPEAISMIIHHAKGIPRVINILCDNALLAGYGLSRRRLDADIIREVIKEMEGPIPHKSIVSKIVKPLKRFHWMPLRHNVYQKRISLVLLSLLCVVGFILLTQGSLKQKPGNTWSIESIVKHRIDTNSHQDSKSQELLQPISPPSGFRSPKQEEGVIEEVIAVRERQTLSSLVQQYYHSVHPTFIDLILDFNPEITNADLILINQRIKIPKITKEWLLNQSPDHTWRIHVGTFQNPSFVRFYRNEPALKGKVIEMFPRKVSPQHTWYRVVVGPFGHKDECLKVIDHLKVKGLLPIFGGIPKME